MNLLFSFGVKVGQAAPKERGRHSEGNGNYSKKRDNKAST